MAKLNILIPVVIFLSAATAVAQEEAEAKAEAVEAEAGPEEAQTALAEESDEQAEESEDDTEADEDDGEDLEASAELQIEDNESRKQKVLGALKEKPGFEIGGRLYGLWMLRDEYLQPTNEFRVSMARLTVKWTQWELVEAAIDLDADQFIAGQDDATLLRDVYVRVQPLSWLGVQMGQFKRPFSRIELRSRRKLPIIDRGEANDFIVDYLMYGDRDIGFMLVGRVWDQIKLDYAVGVFNGMGPNTRDIGIDGFKDIAARIDMKPAKWLSLGFSGSLKFIEKTDLEHFIDLDAIALADFEDVDDGDYPLYVNPEEPEVTLIGFQEDNEWMTGLSWAAGGDLALKFDKFSIVLDAMLAENWWFEKYPYVWSTTLMVSYKKKIVKGWPIWVEPVVMGEVLTMLTGWSQWRNRMWEVAPGVNLHFGKYVRLMIDGELIFVEGVESDIDGARWEGLWPNEWPGNWANSKRLMVQLAFSI